MATKCSKRIHRHKQRLLLSRLLDYHSRHGYGFYPFYVSLSSVKWQFSRFDHSTQVPVCFTSYILQFRSPLRVGWEPCNYGSGFLLSTIVAEIRMSLHKKTIKSPSKRPGKPTLAWVTCPHIQHRSHFIYMY